MTQSPHKIWTIILAAEGSTRFGGPKALAPWEPGGTLLSCAIAKAEVLSGDHHLTVLGGYADALTPYLQDRLSIFNKDWKRGIGTSIICGLRMVMARDPNTGSVLILPVDQPLAQLPDLKQLVATAQEKNKCVFCTDGETEGLPAVIPRKFFPFVLKLNRDHGLRSMLKNSDVIGVPLPLALKNIDAPEDLSILQKLCPPE